MDRFIEGKPGEWYQDKCMFKIQYGQIYRVRTEICNAYFLRLKSNMDRFIAI